MVLELHTPQGTSWDALREDVPVLLAYALSFVYLGIYWNNHHHMLGCAGSAARHCGPTCICCSGSPSCRSQRHG